MHCLIDDIDREDMLAIKGFAMPLISKDRNQGLSN